MSLSPRRSVKRWLILGVVVCLAGAAGLFLASLYLVSRYQPAIRELAIDYLQQRFDAQAELTDLRVHLPEFSPLQLIWNRGHGTIARVEGHGLALRRKDFAGAAPIFVVKSFFFELDLGSLISPPIRVPRISVDGMEINIPPKGQRPSFTAGQAAAPPTQPKSGAAPLVDVSDLAIANIDIVNGRLIIIPSDASRAPLEFAIHQLHLQPQSNGRGMSYQVKLDIPKPPGEATSQGTFGPWNAKSPADSPLQGVYVFEHADLGVFNEIAGKLDSTGKFSGSLGAVSAEGTVTVPDFRLKRGNAVPLTANFQALVDGQNGNTTLHPVRARLGRTEFVTSGAILKHEKEAHRSIQLDVNMPKGDIRDLLRLTMKGDPFLEGDVNLKARINLPPLSGKVQEKLILDGRFDIESGHFLRVGVQQKLDELSRRAQGRPGDHSIDDVFSRMQGVFHMEDQHIAFQSLGFGVPGAQVDLHGVLGLEPDSLDFHGTVRMQAKISEMLTGWKRWVAKPIDPFFAKNGAGTFLRIRVGGTTKSPSFGLELKGSN
jgi:hypothetical protein